MWAMTERARRNRVRCRKRIETCARLRVFSRAGGFCFYCGARLFTDDFVPASWEADHGVPVSQGGHNTLWNLYPACGPCNRDKGGKSINAYRDQADGVFFAEDDWHADLIARAGVSVWNGRMMIRNWEAFRALERAALMFMQQAGFPTETIACPG